MKHIFSIIIVLSFHFFGAVAQVLPLIPLPAEIISGVGRFALTSETKIILKTDTAEVKKACDFFLGIINPSTGYNVGYATTSTSSIFVEIDPQITHPEGYHLKVTLGNITIQAQTPAGIFYAFQTLRQLLPPMIESRIVVANQSWTIPVLEINDAPRFPHRGLMLDVARHFFPVADIKRFIDLMALNKFNRLHLHLTDDQGWRVEILSYPRLQTISAWRRETLVGHLNDEPPQYDGIPHGGYYTQAELRELVQYAADRHITIIPEINFPGHVTALLAAHPELACFTGTVEVAREWGIFPNVLCPRENTFIFIENVLREVINIFPGQYIHIGGNEVMKEQWQRSEFCRNIMIQNNLTTYEQLHTWFMHRIVQFIQSHGRKAIGWDEIIDGGDIPGAVIMSWRGEQGGIAAVNNGNYAIMTPNRFCYFDYYQWRLREEEPLAQVGYLPLSMVYMYEPIPQELTEDQRGLILGAQGILWTEYIKNRRHVEYMTYPRASALAEVTWTPADKKSYPQFMIRLREHSRRLEVMNVNYARHFIGR